MSSILFEYSGEKLILCYAPAMGIDDITKKLSGSDCVPIKHTFFVTKDLLCEDANEEDDWEETLRFCVGTIADSYVELDSEVLGTNHSFYFGNEIKLKPEMFTAYRNFYSPKNRRSD